MSCSDYQDPTSNREMGSSIFNEVQLLNGNLITMKLLKPKIEDYPGKLFKLKIDNPDLDFAEAKDLAKQKAEETGADPMLLSWYQGETGESYPNLEYLNRTPMLMPNFMIKV